MSAPHEELARRMAQRLANETDKSLPALVERVIAEGGADDGPPQRFDPALTLAFAAFVVSVGKAAWDIAKDLREQREKSQQAAAQAPRIEALEKEVAFLRGALLPRLRIEVEAPAQMTARLRDQILEVAAEEAVAETEPRRAER